MNDLTPLMIHVERIVRPVRALDRRKLAMRRELLAHLQSALGEEETRNSDPAAALAAAQRRLGDSAQLTRSLQSTVPWLERILLWNLPLPRWARGWERRHAEKMGMSGMTLTQASVYTLGLVVVSYGAMIALGMVYVAKYRESAIRALADHTMLYPLGHILGNLLLIVFLGLCFKVLGKVVTQKAPPRTLALYAMAMAAILMSWMAIVVRLVAGQTPGWVEIACAPPAAALVVLLLVPLGRLVVRMGKGHTEWLRLDISSQATPADS